jgi:hypothetical protein
MEGQGQAMMPRIKSTAVGAPGMIANPHNVNETVLEKVPSGSEMQDV